MLKKEETRIEPAENVKLKVLNDAKLDTESQVENLEMRLQEECGNTLKLQEQNEKLVREAIEYSERCDIFCYGNPASQTKQSKTKSD